MRALSAHWKTAAVVVLVAAILGVALWPEAVEVDVAPVVRGALVVTIDEEGQTRIPEKFVVSAPVAGRVERIRLEPGDPVIAGQTVVARIAPAPPSLLDPRTERELAAAVEAARAALGQAQAEQGRAEAALNRARSAAERQQTLFEAGAVSRDELEAAQTALRAAEEAYRAATFTVSRAEGELAAARARLQRPAAASAAVNVTAPASGVVLRRLRQSEAIVPAGEALVEIGDPADIEVVADLLSTDAVRVSPGDRVLIEQWGGSEPLHGRVERVEPAGFMKVSALGVEEQRVNVIIEFADPAAAAQRLGDAYRVEVRIVEAALEDALTVPVGSLFRRGEEWAVFVVDAEGRARLRTVQIGRRNAQAAEVLSGLEENDRVIMHPPDTLVDATRVTERTLP